MVAAVAMMEAAIDFNDEEGVEHAALMRAAPMVQTLIAELEDAQSVSARASAVRAGVRIVIGGPSNAGKSSLLNVLVSRDAAIVSPVAGTTRDIVEAATVFAGVPVVLRDTAGLRPATDDDIEAAGMAKAARAMQDADVLIWVTSPDTVDASPPRRPDVLVINKMDLLPEKLIHLRNDSNEPPGILISAQSGEGLQEFRRLLEGRVAESYQGLDQAVVIRERHRIALEKCISSLRASLRETRSVEIIAEHLRQAARALSSVSGHVDVEEYLGKIFSTFCIGK